MTCQTPEISRFPLQGLCLLDTSALVELCSAPKSKTPGPSKPLTQGESNLTQASSGPKSGTPFGSHPFPTASSPTAQVTPHPPSHPNLVPTLAALFSTGSAVSPSPEPDPDPDPDPGPDSTSGVSDRSPAPIASIPVEGLTSVDPLLGSSGVYTLHPRAPYALSQLLRFSPGALGQDPAPRLLLFQVRVPL